MNYQNQPTSFIEEPGRKGIEIIEGWKRPGKVFSIKRFLGRVPNQDPQKETDALARMLLEVLKDNVSLVGSTFSKHETSEDVVIVQHQDGAEDKVIFIMQPQETEEETQELAEMILQKLNA